MRARRANDDGLGRSVSQILQKINGTASVTSIRLAGS
jgi:hypothetical protein